MSGLEARGRLPGEPVAIVDIGSNSVRLVAYEALSRALSAVNAAAGSAAPKTLEPATNSCAPRWKLPSGTGLPVTFRPDCVCHFRGHAHRFIKLVVDA